MFIGIDLGTSGVKLLLVDEAGAIVKSVSREYPISFPHPGWSEQNPEDWWTQTLDGLSELLRGCDGSRVRGLSFGGQMHGLVVLDRCDRVLRPAILWNDGRTVREVEYLNETVGRETLSARTANIAFAGFTAPKLLWMRQNEPELFERIDKIMLPKDYLAYRFTGVHSADASDASGMLLYDVQNRRWSEEMLALCGLNRGQMATVFESYEPIGTVLPALADLLGLPGDVVVAAGAGDNAAAAVGTGTVGDGRCNISLGTSGTVFIASDAFRVDPHNALHAFAHADGRYHLMGCMLSAASCNRWWLEEILGTDDYAGSQRGIAADRLGENRVFFLPYLMGERSPHNDPLARGAFIGMSMDTGRADMTQAVLEGVAFAIRDSFEVARSLGISIRASRVCGGGAKSPLWRKIISNVLDIPLELLPFEEGPGYGAAMLAAVACGAFSSVDEAAARLVRPSGTEEPDAALAARYEARYREFTRLYPALRPLYAQLFSSVS